MHGRGMRAAAFVVTAAATMLLGLGAVAQADHPGGGGKPFGVVLSGANEVPRNPHGNADRGSVTLRLNPGQEEICFSFGALTLSPGEALPTAAHIHEAPAGEAGPVVVPLFTSTNAPTRYPTGTRCVSADRELIREIMKNPQNYYVNLHNATHPTGVVRGQLG